MQWYEAAILGLVEGITEYLPISSTGHLILVSEWLGLNSDPAQKAAVDTYNIVIQGGAILAVLGLYRARVLQMIRGIFGRDAEGRALFINIIIAFLPAVVLGLLLEKVIEEKLFFTVPAVGALAVVSSKVASGFAVLDGARSGSPPSKKRITRALARRSCRGLAGASSR